MSDEMVRAYWYEHDCEWTTKYCDDNHRRATFVPLRILRAYALRTTIEGEEVTTWLGQPLYGGLE